MASPIEAQLILADAAQADPSGKVHILGAGWSRTSSPTAPQAVVVLMKIPWDRANQKLPRKVELLDADGHPVEIDTLEGSQRIAQEGSIEVGRPAGVAAGSLLDAAFVLNVPGLPLEPGRYEWKLTVAEETLASSFTVMA